MTRDEAVSAIAGVLEAVEDDDMATVIYQAIDRANVRKNIARKRGGSSLRQGVIAELYQIDFPKST